jgi:RNA-directed DNA polymerase
MVEWKHIPWRKLERVVFKLQKRIFKASQRGDIKAVRRLQKTLMRAWSAKCLAVRRVTQDNQGKKTAGVDGVKSLTLVQRLALVQNLRLSRKAKPTRRVWIAKPASQEKRPLGIPTMAERALQALLKQALEPEWEARFEPNSYGFRPGRSAHDAIVGIFLAIRLKAKYVLDADIAKCFDRINHEALLDKLNTFPLMRRQIRAWLKAGVMDEGTLFPTSEDTPQGGIVSPLLANIALHGMEERVKQVDIHTQFIRYADDFVCMHEDLSVVQRCQQVIAEWLQEMGLELKASKTRLTHTLHEHEGESGFDFLGFTVRQFPVGKYQSGKNRHGKTLGFKTLIKPSQRNLIQHEKRMRSIMRTHKTATQAVLITRLNPMIRGWSNYYSTVVSKASFSKADNHLYQLLKVWAQHRHPNKSHHWITRKYWRTVGNDRWSFARDFRGKLHRLLKHSETPIKRHIKVQGMRSPFDGDWNYWSTRMGRHPTLSAEVAKLLKRQKGKCPYCGLYFKNGDLLESDHIVPNSLGGSETLCNKQLLHRHCHDQKTSVDGSNKARTTASLSEEESQQKEELLKAWNPYKDKQRQSDEEWRKQWQ